MSSSTPQRVVVLGSSFAGMTAALELRRRLDERHEVVVLDPRDRFTFIPSLIWMPFGAREAADVTFPLAPLYGSKGIEFFNETAARVAVDGHTVTTASGRSLEYDKLLVATGPRLAFEKIPGLGPDGGFTQSVCNLEHAERARDAWGRFLEDPGPVVVGTAQGGSCFGASYEFLFNVHHRIRKAGLEGVAPVTFISSEPFLGHFGLGGVGDSAKRVEGFLERLGIEGIPNSSIKEVRDGEIELEGGRVLPFAYSMIVPPFTGVDAVRESEGRQSDGVRADRRSLPPPRAGRRLRGRGRDRDRAARVNRGARRRPEDGADERGDGQGRRREHRRRPDREHASRPSDCRALSHLRTGRGRQRHHLQGRQRPRPRHLRRRRRTDRPGDGGAQAHWAKLAFERYFLASRKRGLTAI